MWTAPPPRRRATAVLRRPASASPKWSAPLPTTTTTTNPTTHHHAPTQPSRCRPANAAGVPDSGVRWRLAHQRGRTGAIFLVGTTLCRVAEPPRPSGILAGAQPLQDGAGRGRSAAPTVPRPGTPGPGGWRNAGQFRIIASPIRAWLTQRLAMHPPRARPSPNVLPRYRASWSIPGRLANRSGRWGDRAGRRPAGTT